MMNRRTLITLSIAMLPFLLGGQVSKIKTDSGKAQILEIKTIERGEVVISLHGEGMALEGTAVYANNGQNFRVVIVPAQNKKSISVQEFDKDGQLLGQYNISRTYLEDKSMFFYGDWISTDGLKTYNITEMKRNGQADKIRS